MLRPALELSLGVARTGMVETPPITPPGPIRPLLRFAKLSERALAILRDTVEEDGEFRRRVAEQADETIIGRLAYVWLTRPEGWIEELQAAQRARAVAAAAVADERAERSARRRLASVEAALARAEVDAREAKDLAATAGDEVATQRLARRRAEQEARDRAEALDVTAGTVAELRTALDQATGARRGLEALVDDAHRRIDELVVERDRALARAGAAESAADDDRARLASRENRSDEVRTLFGRAVEDAAGAARLLGEALATAAGALGREDDGIRPHRQAGEAAKRPIGEDAQSGADEPRRPREVVPTLPTLPTLPGRRPVSLPPAVFDDSPEAAAFLTRIHGMVLLVDGYNVSLTGWPGEELAAQRRYLVNRLAPLAARGTATVWVIFDGAEDHWLPPPRGSPREAVRVAFSPTGVDADEVIIDRVDALPVATPVVVATSDRRVATEVARRGANVISTPQILHLIGRAVRG
ncbi:MAG: NYN domain-containing protein [Actinomycetota bacterium]|nr:NYN domain-containing protein [Actinomycetota bacterium]